MRAHSISLTLAITACGGGTPKPAPTPPVDDAKFVLTVGGSVTTPAGKTPLVATKQIHEKDTLFLTVSSTKRTQVYVAYCDSHGQLAIYPPTGSLIAEPNLPTRAPRGEPFVVDAHTGLESLFVIATVGDLDRHDPRLDQVIHAKSATECPAELGMTTAESRGLAGAAGEPSAVREPRGMTPADEPRATPVEAPPNKPAAIEAPPPDKPVVHHPPVAHRVAEVWRPRGLIPPDEGATDTSSVESDAAGIAIWAITLDHK